MAQLTKPTINAIFSLPEPDGAFRAPELALFRQISAKRKCVFLSFPPKSAGTFFRTAIIHAINGQLVRTMHAQGGRDATPYLPTFVAYYIGGVTQRTLVSHTHMLALPANQHFLNAFNIRPVIMRRSIPDMLRSYSDMLDKDPAARQDGLNCRIPVKYPEWSDEAKADFLIDVLAPWYVNYFATWREYIAAEKQRILVLDYAEVKETPERALEKTISHSGLKADKALIREGLEQAWATRDTLRYNQGQTGRGRVFFQDRHLDRLRRMMGFYPQLADWADYLAGTPQAEELTVAAS